MGALGDITRSEVIDLVVEQSLKKTVFSGLLAAMTWPSLILKVADVIDNPWSVIMARSEKASVILANVIQSRLHGRRPLTLIGYSMGARLIFLALEQLSKQRVPSSQTQDTLSKENSIEQVQESKNDDNGIIMNVILLGAPVSTDKKRWSNIRRIVAGRVINCYSSRDWMLNFLFRSTQTTLSVAGLKPVDVKGIENFNVKDIIGIGHH